jgi:hypothetical protein
VPLPAAAAPHSSTRVALALHSHQLLLQLSQIGEHETACNSAAAEIQAHIQQRGLY